MGLTEVPFEGEGLGRAQTRHAPRPENKPSPHRRKGLSPSSNPPYPHKEVRVQAGNTHTDLTQDRKVPERLRVA